MSKIKEIIRRSESNLSQREIARSLKTSRNTVSFILDKAKRDYITYDSIKNLCDDEIESIFMLNKRKTPDSIYTMPDYKNIVKELERPGVTMQLLWEEYVNECRLANKIPYRITQFKVYFKDYIKENDFSDILNHKPGEEIQVDWAGDKVSYKDPYSGLQSYGYLFVGVLAYSGYSYCEAFKDMKEESWIKGHTHMYEYFNGVSRLLVPDNLKTGVLSHKKDEVILNKVYEEMAEHYGTVIVPTRVKRPKDKALVENTVGKLSSYIIARLRDYQFFSLKEYNDKAKEFLDEFNKKSFQKKDGSRYSVYLNVEKDKLLPLPKYPYELSKYKKAIVQNNSHICFSSSFYSVPYRYIGEEVDVKYSDYKVNIYFKNNLIASHARSYIRGEYVTNKDDMPKVSNASLKWNKERYISWANNVGINTLKVVENLFDRVSVEQQAYRCVTSLLKLSSKFSKTRLESACELALKHISTPSYKNIKAILNNNQDIKENSKTKEVTLENTFVRGGKYYEK